MRYRLRHTTSYTYSWAVDISYHLLHLALPELPRQRVHACSVTTNPNSGRLSAQIDHFGNRVAYLTIDAPHKRFDVELRAEVEVDPFAGVDPEATPPWESLRDMLDGNGFPAPVLESEFVHASPFAQADAEAVAYALQSFTPSRPVLAAAKELTERIFRDFRYDPAATEVFTPVSEVMKQRAGVCQDFAHLQISMLRGLGLAARYVSGYIRTLKEGETTGLRGADASHAWLSVWCGPELGWVDLDPTNNMICSDQHVTAALGRDYGDISPVRGVVLGGGPHRIGVAVELLPLG
ncbi:transglutaminase family protein [uncultured Ferrovibrio sp.]|jgi:transglutaminase-like putative cysteine protease|uniref:transglutaminase family protein n=1 Tax=uncultured Ferrovibrio sp. TaxID=1576913 RepID=UPI00260DA73B|nr:transglutaminase family protein [uncultured Ferrovibrio sp.]